MSHIAPELKMLPSEYVDRNVKIGSSNTRRRERPVATRSASGTSCGATISPTPKARGPTPGSG